MKRKHLSLKPQRAKSMTLTWYYEEAGGIQIYHELTVAERKALGPLVIKIPWRLLKRSVARASKK